MFLIRRIIDVSDHRLHILIGVRCPASTRDAIVAASLRREFPTGGHHGDRAPWLKRGGFIREFVSSGDHGSWLQRVTRRYSLGTRDERTYGRGPGVGRGLGVGPPRGVGVGLGVTVGVAVAVLVAVAVGVAVGVGVGPPTGTTRTK